MKDGQTQSGKSLHWMGSSKKDLKAFPKDVTSDIGAALRAVQQGVTPHNVKPLKGFHGADVLEIVDRHDTDTYRVVYTVRFRTSVYVLHAFLKKSTQGIKTPQRELDVVGTRLQMAANDYAWRYGND